MLKKAGSAPEGGHKAEEEGVRVTLSPAPVSLAEEAEEAMPSLAMLSSGWEVWWFLANSVPGLGTVFSRICLEEKRWKRHGEGVGARTLFSSGTGEIMLVCGKRATP